MKHGIKSAGLQKLGRNGLPRMCVRADMAKVRYVKNDGVWCLERMGQGMVSALVGDGGTKGKNGMAGVESKVLLS